MKQKKLMSIGEMSKHTGASIKSLRYYEQLKILKPAYTDPGTGYRYYSSDQSYLIGIIMFCIELDIPLKELSQYVEADRINFRNFLARGKEIAENKLIALNKGLKLCEEIERQMDLTELYEPGQLYPRKEKEKYFYVIPCPPAKDMSPAEQDKLFLELPYDENDSIWFGEYGFMYEHTPEGVVRYAFVEVLNHTNGENVKVIPGGIYYCCLSKAGQIDNASEIFKARLAGKDSFIAIETEVMSNTFEIANPLGELRVI